MISYQTTTYSECTVLLVKWTTSMGNSSPFRSILFDNSYLIPYIPANDLACFQPICRNSLVDILGDQFAPSRAGCWCY